jgi:hypothetical protein
LGLLANNSMPDSIKLFCCLTFNILYGKNDQHQQKLSKTPAQSDSCQRSKSCCCCRRLHFQIVTDFAAHRHRRLIVPGPSPSPHTKQPNNLGPSPKSLKPIRAFSFHAPSAHVGHGSGRKDRTYSLTEKKLNSQRNVPIEKRNRNFGQMRNELLEDIGRCHVAIVVDVNVHHTLGIIEDPVDGIEHHPFVLK